MRKLLTTLVVATVLGAALGLLASLEVQRRMAEAAGSALGEGLRAVFAAATVAAPLLVSFEGEELLAPPCARRLSLHAVVCEGKGPRLDRVEQALGLRPDGEPVEEYEYHQQLAPHWFASAFN